MQYVEIFHTNWRIIINTLRGETFAREKTLEIFGIFANGSPEFISREINFRVYKKSCNSRGINFRDSQKKAYIFSKKKKKKENEKNNIFILKSKHFLA